LGGRDPQASPRKDRAIMPKQNGMPSSVDTERIVFGIIMMNPAIYDRVSAVLSIEDFSLESHRRIYRRMQDIYKRGEPVDRVLVANELMAHGELESVGGLGYLVSLNEQGLYVPNPDAYCKLIKDKSSLRTGAIVSQKAMNKFLLDDQPAVEIFREVISELTKASDPVDHSQKKLVSFEDVAKRYKGGLPAFLSPSHEMGISTGYPSLDDYTYGLQKGKTYVVAARSSHGKTAMMGNIASKVAEGGDPVLYISLEMSTEAMFHRILCAKAKVSFSRMVKGTMTSFEKQDLTEAASKVTSWPLFFDETSNMTIAQVRRRIERAVCDNGAKLAVVDYIQRMPWTSDKDHEFKGSAYAAMSAYSTQFKDMSMRMDIPIMIGCQMSRKDKKSKNYRPELWDLRDSGRIEEDADVVVSPYYEWRDKMDDDRIKNKAEWIVLKNRIGAVGSIPMFFDYNYVHFREDKPIDQEEEYKYGGPRRA
jgi:replicative DNA helicase